MKIFLISYIFTFITILFANNEKRVWIYFKDKGIQNEKNISKIVPLTLSKKAINRRFNKKVIPVFDKTDLPLNKSYLDQLKKLGVTIYRKSKWLNAVSAYLNDVDEKEDLWIYREAANSEIAREIEEYFIDVLGTDGGEGGGDEDARYVYAYRKNNHTSP